MTEPSVSTVGAELAQAVEDLATARADYGRLEAALRSRLDIGIAMGILMERHRLPQEQAFDVLRSASQRQNVKLSEIAARMVSTGSLEA